MLTQEQKVATRRALAEVRSYLTAGKAPCAFTSGTPVVVAVDSDTVEDVMQRVTKYAPPVILAVHYPADDRVELVTLEPGQRSTDPPGDDSIRVNGKASIGMVIDAGARIAMPGQWDEVVVPHRLPAASC